MAARRTRFGQTLIHGVCGTIKALDLLLQQEKLTRPALDQGEIQQASDPGSGSDVFGETSGGITRLELFADGIRCQIIDLELAQTSKKSSPPGALLAPA